MRLPRPGPHRAPLALMAALGLGGAATLVVLALVDSRLALAATLPAAGLVTVACGAALLRWGAPAGRRLPPFRTAGGLATIVYGLGQLTLGLQPLVTGAPRTHPSPGDLVTIGAAPFALWLLVALPKPPGTAGRLHRLVPDGLVAGLAGALLLWRVVFLAPEATGNVTPVISIGLVLEVTLVSLVLQLAITSLDRGMVLLTAGLAGLASLDTLSTRWTLQSEAPLPWETGMLQCAAWPMICAGLLLLTARGAAGEGPGGRWRVDHEARVEARSSSTTVVLLFGCATGIAVTAGAAPLDVVTILLLLALVLTLGVREVVLQRLRVRQIVALNHLVHHDPLTRLGNRRAIQAQLVRASSAGVASVLVLDLDGFKGVNDQLGHSSGDALLVEVADALRTFAPGELTAFRLGGDEFALVGSLGTDRMAELARGLSSSVAAAASRVPGVERVRLSASSGIAPVDGDPQSALAAVTHAGTAMQVAKRQGRDRVVLYDAGIAAGGVRAAAVDVRLRRALARGEVVVHLQPLVDLAHHAALPDGAARSGLSDQRVVGFEALARWRDDELGDVPPLEFVAVAEATGTVVALGRSLLHRALEALVLCGGVEAGLSVAVNASPIELRAPRAVEGFRAALLEHGVPAELLVVEVTESMLVSVDDPAVVALAALREIGVRIAVDDFGTGYSSLAYLTRLPIDVLKLDRSLVSTVADPAARAVVEAVTTMAGALHLTLVAEGVEHPWQAEVMAALGVHRGQGWLWSRALPPTEAALVVAAAGASVAPTGPRAASDDDRVVLGR